MCIKIHEINVHQIYWVFDVSPFIEISSMSNIRDELSGTSMLSAVSTRWEWAIHMRMDDLLGDSSGSRRFMGVDD